MSSVLLRAHLWEKGRQTWNAHCKLCFLYITKKKEKKGEWSNLPGFPWRHLFILTKPEGTKDPHKWMLDKCNRKIINSNSWHSELFSSKPDSRLHHCFMWFSEPHMSCCHLSFKCTLCAMWFDLSALTCKQTRISEWSLLIFTNHPQCLGSYVFIKLPIVSLLARFISPTLRTLSGVRCPSSAVRHIE